MKAATKKATVSLEFKLMDASGLATFADGTVVGLTNNAKFSSPTVPLTTITSQTATLRATTGQRSAGNKSIALTKQEASHGGILIQSLTTNGHYVEDTANTLAVGDVGVAQQLILSTGYTLKGHGAPAPRTFEVVATGPSWAHIRAKKTLPAGAEGHLWRFGITVIRLLFGRRRCPGGSSGRSTAGGRRRTRQRMPGNTPSSISARRTATAS